MAATNQRAMNMLLTATHTQWVHLSCRRSSHGALAGQKTSPVTLALASGTWVSVLGYVTRIWGLWAWRTLWTFYPVAHVFLDSCASIHLQKNRRRYPGEGTMRKLAYGCWDTLKERFCFLKTGTWPIWQGCVMVCWKGRVFVFAVWFLCFVLFYQMLLWDRKAESSHPHTGHDIFLCHSVSFTFGFTILFENFILWDLRREIVKAQRREGDRWTCSFIDEYWDEAYVMGGVRPVWWFGYSDTQPTFRNNECRMGWILLISSPHETVLKWQFSKNL